MDMCIIHMNFHFTVDGSQKQPCIVYTSAYYTRVHSIHECIVYTSAYYTRVHSIHECIL